MAAATAAPAAGREQKGLLQKLLAEQTAAAKEVLRLNRELEQQLQQSSLDSTSGQASSATAAHGAVRPPPRVQPRHSPPQEYRVLSEPLLGGEAASDQIDAGTWAFVPGSKFILGGVSSVGSMVGGIGQGISGALFAGPHDEEAAAAQDAARGDEVHVRTEEDAVKAAKMNRQKSKLLVLQSIQPQSEACPTESLYRQGSFWTSLALSHTFTTTSMVAIILNSVWIAVDTDHNKADVLSDAPLLYQIVDNFFCFFFFGELFVRFMAFDRARNVFKDGWFIFDATIVACMVWETWIQVALFLLIGIKGAGGLMNASVLRIFRIFRLTRVVRMGRLIHLWPELFILASAVAQAMRSVVATILLLCIVIYIFALVFVVLLSGTPVGRASFPNVPAAAMLLLLNVICGFDKDVITGLQEHGVVCFLLFLLYFMLGQLTMMNMLIGVVCEVVSVEAQREKEVTELKTIKAQVTKMVESVEGQSETLCRTGFEEMAQSREIMLGIHELGIDVVALVDFLHIAFHATDEIEISDFLEMVIQFRGAKTATVKDVADMQKFVSLEIRSLGDRLKTLHA
eukprot:TRINITY_DN25566_c0_g1_i3.p1 TRINITY_DN25566_c0_g1~~TRINITY_DN25566_c0_g1_i3.p1  ORF type:complete len:569 (-),score=130.29 TRINITY_DN25566_c0_g1_i3:15-1721(-)